MADGLPTGIDQLPSGLYRARYRCQGCARHAEPSQHSQSFARLSDAKRWRTAQMAAVDVGTHVDTRQTQTVSECAVRYVETLDHEPASSRTMTTYLAALARHPLGARRIADVRSSDISAWRADLQRKYAATTVANRYGWLRAVFNAATEDRIIPASPFTSRTRPRVRRPERPAPMTVEEVKDLADALPEHLRALVVFMAGTGVRLGEALGTSVNDLDLDSREVRVHRQLRRNDHTLAPLKTARTGVRERTLPLPAHTVFHLRTHLDAYGPGPDGLLWRGERGGMLRHDSAIRALADAAKTSEQVGRSAVDLRHHYASTLAANGVDVFKIAQALGHTTPRLVIATYGHLVPDGGTQVRRVMDAAWSVVTDVSPAAGRLAAV